MHFDFQSCLARVVLFSVFKSWMLIGQERFKSAFISHSYKKKKQKKNLYKCDSYSTGLVQVSKISKTNTPI